ncbi:MAG: flagellar biosynthetic protein FliR [Gammaproteobacteria bacterium]|jgi:flagellar biosynthesis protein FliR
MTITTGQITAFIGTYYWPFMRIGAMLMVAPVFGSQQIVPVRVRLALAIALTWAVAPTLAAAPAVQPMSAMGLLVTAQQLLLGIAMGFILQLAFSALVVAGQSIAMTMGLGFATFIDPTNGVSVPVMSKFYTIVGTLLFLSINGHLVAIQVLAASFQTIPVAPVGLSAAGMIQLVAWGGQMFVGAALIALPALVTITLINVSFGVVTRAAPQFNIFAVGLPTTIASGFLIMWFTLPNLLPRFTHVLMGAFGIMQHLAPAGG